MIQQASQNPTPPIPPVPSAPGAGTGATTVTTIQVGPGATPEQALQAAQNAINARQNALQAAENAAQAIRNAEQATQNGVIAGEGVVLQPPPSPTVVRVNPEIPPEVIPIVAIIFGSIAFMVVTFPIVRGIMRFIERRQDRNLVHGPAVAQQLAQLQQSVDALAIEVERISEAQRFQSKLMADRERPALGEGSTAR